MQSSPEKSGFWSVTKIPHHAKLKQHAFENLAEKVQQKKLYMLCKRLFDFILALKLLIFLAPLFLLFIILIKLDSPGPAIFKQRRSGFKGKPFYLYKFRTMFQDVQNQAFAPTTADDLRVTKIGRFLRQTSLDELPQLLNILKGEMALIGPRPEMTFISDHYTQAQKQRFLVKPGLTGLWQVMGRKDLPLHENIEYDYYYLTHQSLRLDLYILGKTFSVVLSRKGAY
jgi:undecaprenyl phosphate N,N'-diacetylbacillosamine 1-phosphate transferase